MNENIVAIVPYVGSNHKPINEKTNRKAEWENQKVDRYRYLIATGLFLSIILHGIIRYANGYSIGNLLIQSANAQSSIKRDETPPAKLDNGVNAPNWSKINFSSMKFSEDGSVDFPNIKNPGMKEKRTWTTRQSLADVMELGDFEETEFKIQDLNLNQISKITGDSFKDLKLSDFELIQWQTLADLNAIVPNLSKLKVKSIPPIADFLKKALPGKNYSNSTIAQVLKKNPKLKKIELGKYIDTKKYKLNSIPNLDKTPIKKFTNWQNNTIAKIPGLSKVPFSEFPGIPVPDMSMVGKVDIVLKQVENQRWKSISGSYQEGFNVPCYNKQCAHIEVSGSNNLTGAAWMSGKYQKVKGGFGILGSLGGGKEPTGRHPFGKAFKQVLWEPNEAKGSITSMMFFRVCKRGFIDLGCSPYNIGPVPFFEYKETDAIILGTPLTVPKQATP
ncbi:MAG: hypothetical protein HC815_05895 [Richelia sp. RM1_1_1]|nr:hypothetical protein [Richelia sp. RM1_1_1]